MVRTLSQLKESIELLIEQQGLSAPCATFIFTNEDVFFLDEEGNPQAQPMEVCESVLNDLEEVDYIYEQIFAIIDEKLQSLGVIK